MDTDIIWETLHWNDLSTERLYDILALRSEVFVVEQDCVYQDLDHRDRRALHLTGSAGDGPVAYARLFAPGECYPEAAIGRVIVRADRRGTGLGHELMRRAAAAIDGAWGERRITISAQQHLERFYAAHGFRRAGEGYLEDGIPHIKMKKG